MITFLIIWCSVLSATVVGMCLKMNQMQHEINLMHIREMARGISLIPEPSNDEASR